MDVILYESVCLFEPVILKVIPGGIKNSAENYGCDIIWVRLFVSARDFKGHSGWHKHSNAYTLPVILGRNMWVTNPSKRKFASSRVKDKRRKNSTQIIDKIELWMELFYILFGPTNWYSQLSVPPFLGSIMDSSKKVIYITFWIYTSWRQVTE